VTNEKLLIIISLLDIFLFLAVISVVKIIDKGKD